MAGLGTSELLIILDGLHDDDPAEPQTSSPSSDAREQAARLREEATRLERQAGPQPLTGPQPTLPPARPRRATVQPTERRDTDPARS
ncbi:hypothetical protein GCM10009727_12120 [Actinomadura napierensis]|uniref:Uncharacterized protein n=1 Tax=Actinomadura napierensis TaxID=267854 RepID=A0ABP5JYL1_9ACTN